MTVQNLSPHYHHIATCHCKMSPEYNSTDMKSLFLEQTEQFGFIFDLSFIFHIHCTLVVSSKTHYHILAYSFMILSFHYNISM